MKRFLGTVVLLIAILVVGCAPQQAQDATPTPIPTSVVPDKPTYVVQRGTVENIEEFTARVSPIKEESLYFQKSGYVTVVYVEKGDWVEEGTVLAELELEDLVSQLNLAKVDLDSAQKQYASAEEAQQRKLFDAQMTLDVANLRLERAKTQAPIQDFTSLKLSVERAKESLDEAEIAYKEALDRPWEPQKVRDGLLKNIKQAQRNYTEVQANYQKALRQADQAQKAYDADIQLLEMDVKQAEQELAWLQQGLDPAVSQGLETTRLKVQRLEDQLKTGQLTAPFAGEITTLNVVPGRAAEAHKPVAVIADPSEVDITADLTTAQLSLLEEGQSAQVALGREPGKIYEATITQLPYPYGTGGGEAKVEDQDERAHIELVNPSELKVEAGDLVKVSVLIERSENTLWLPPAAIRTFEGRNFVMVKEEDRLRKVDIKVGIEGEDRFEILTGLEEGQIVEGL
jgi:multidrug efflux pump subunit AcrA (membrane-fusion protein)